jgi:hypothetical protein
MKNKIAILLLLAVLLSPVEAQIAGRSIFPAKECLPGLDMCVVARGVALAPKIIWESPGGGQTFLAPTVNCEGSGTTHQVCTLTVNLND